MTQWRIKGYDGTTEILSGEFYADAREVRRMLRELAATGLTPNEVFMANIGDGEFLHVAREDGGLKCGNNPHFTAQRLSDH